MRNILAAACILMFITTTARAVDSDWDGVDDSVDNAPSHYNPDQGDADGDGVGNAVDTDLDQDGVLNTQDNVPLLPNADQADFDGDGIGDAGDSSPVDAGLPLNRQVIAALPALMPYDPGAGTGLLIDISGSSNPLADYFSISFDLDNNGIYGDATGFGISTSGDWFFLSDATLASYGLDAGQNTIGLEISNNLTTDTVTGIVQVPEPASLSLLAIGGLALLRRRRR